MPGIGTIVNAAAVIAGGCVGLCLKRGLKQRYQDTIMQAIGRVVLFLGIAGALEKMFTVSGGTVASSGSMLAVVSLVLGAVTGEFLDIERRLEQFGDWLRVRLHSERDPMFVEGFVTTSLTICVGAMAVVGALEDGIGGDPSMLFTKAILDCVIVMVFAAGYGKGAICSFIPVALFQGTVTVLARVIEPLLTASMIDAMSMVGSMLIFCVGVNIMFPVKLKVANMLPALVFAVLYVGLGF